MTTHTPGAPAPANTPLFPLGQVVATPAVLAHFQRHGVSIDDTLRRHVTGDWPDLCPADVAENALSIEQGYRILSVYEIAGRRVWIVTEADRSSTCLLFPSEY